VTALPDLDQLQGLWKQQVGAAKVAWGKLTDDELLTVDGHHEKLVGLIQERYELTRAQAALQAQQFFDAWKV
jgi:uncharacterized protein YjbJ (UPF0337 family)